MNRKIIIIVLLIVSFKGFSADLDTLNYWHVYKNDKIIAKFHSGSKDLNIKISKSNIKKTDTISIRYVSCTRSYNSTYFLFVRDERKRKLRITKSEKESSRLSLGLLDLIELGKKNNSKRYDFYYSERNCDGENQLNKLVLKVTLD